MIEKGKLFDFSHNLPLKCGKGIAYNKIFKKNEVQLQALEIEVYSTASHKFRNDIFWGWQLCY
jgi:hypothetical protein